MLLAVDDAALILFSICFFSPPSASLCPNTGPAVRHPELLVVGGGGPLTGPAAPVVPAQGDGGGRSIASVLPGGPLGPPSRPDAPAAIAAQEPEGVGRREGAGVEGSVFEERAPAHPSGWSDEAPGLCGARIGRILLGGQKPRLLWANRRAGVRFSLEFYADALQLRTSFSWVNCTPPS